ncbi:MAG: hypothetical protein WBA22_01515 [Candidatus Methanofastidiosia archaeon]
MIDVITKQVCYEGKTPDKICILLAQLRNTFFQEKENFFRLQEPEKRLNQIKEIILKMNYRLNGFQGVDFLLFPEGSIPFKYKNEILDFIVTNVRKESFLLLCFDHIELLDFVDLLKKSENSKKKKYVEKIEGITNYDSLKKEKPVNCFMLIHKKSSQEFEYFVQAKISPFHGECKIDPRDLFNGQYVIFIKSKLANFLFFICRDFIARNDKEGPFIFNALRDRLKKIRKDDEKIIDFIFVPQCNPDPENRRFIFNVLSFYEGHFIPPLAAEKSYVVFLNTDKRTELHGISKDNGFGETSVYFPGKLRESQRLETEYEISFPEENINKLRLVSPYERLYFIGLEKLRNLARSHSSFPARILHIEEKCGGSWTEKKSHTVSEGFLPKNFQEYVLTEILLRNVSVPSNDFNRVFSSICKISYRDYLDQKTERTISLDNLNLQISLSTTFDMICGTDIYKKLRILDFRDYSINTFFKYFAEKVDSIEIKESSVLFDFVKRTYNDILDLITSSDYATMPISEEQRLVFEIFCSLDSFLLEKNVSFKLTRFSIVQIARFICLNYESNKGSNILDQFLRKVEIQEVTEETIEWIESEMAHLVVESLKKFCSKKIIHDFENSEIGVEIVLDALKSNGIVRFLNSLYEGTNLPGKEISNELKNIEIRLSNLEEIKKRKYREGFPVSSVGSLVENNRDLIKAILNSNQR